MSMRGSLISWILVLLVLLALLLALSMYLPSRPGGVSATISETTWGNVTVVRILYREVSVPYARLYVLVDNNAWDGFKTAWGLSIFVETPRGNVLFDTGPDPGVLSYNAERLGLDPCNVSAVVISHEHMDHIGGLAYIAKHCPRTPVYVPKGISKASLEWMRKLGLRDIRVVDATTSVLPGVYVLSPLMGPPSEESLAINVTGRGIVVLVGCSHPGIVRIVRHAEKLLGERVLLVMGGFHLAWAPENEVEKIARSLIGLNVSYIAPIHCSGDTIRSLLARNYPSHYIEAHVGTVIEVGGNCPTICTR